MTRHIGNSREVVAAFLEGRSLRTAATGVPGGCRVRSEQDATHPNRTNLYSYRTVVAVRLPEGRIAITPQRYSVTTSKLVNGIRRQLGDATGELIPVQSAVPGRWGGYGPAWHETGWVTLPFVVFERS